MISDNKKITVLGKTFNTEEERRTYFREELRKLLPELKKMEGFPIGEDDDIINLSDPPFYTACPNPWLNDFIAEWEDEKKQLEKDGKREKDFEVDEPYAADISEGKFHPIYRAHSYHTKVPPLALMRYVLYYTQPGDIVFDGFAGTCMTGVASQLCSNPELDFKFKVETEFKKVDRIVEWGARKSINGDLSPIATHIGANFNSSRELNNLVLNYKKVLDNVEKSLGWMYETKHTNGEIGKINFSVLSNVFTCNNCGGDIVFWDEAMDYESGKVSKQFECPSCSSLVTKRDIAFKKVTMFDEKLEDTISITQDKVVLINYSYQGKRYQKKPDSDDIKNYEKISNTTINGSVDAIRMCEGKESRRNDKAGITHVHHFFSRRNLIYISKFIESINSIGKEYKKEFLFILTGMIPRASLMHKFKKGQTTGTTSGTLYIPSLKYEYNVYKMLSERSSLLKKLYTFGLQKENAIINVASAANSSIKDNSIDYVFTDPPFGANLMYSELNFIWEGFLKVYTNNAEEAIESRSQNKSSFDYHQLMLSAFKEYFRILKPSKWMTVEFSNTNAAIWNGIQNAITNSGFIIGNVSALDKIQGSFKAVNTVTAVKQDLVISCYKPSSGFDEKFKQHQNTDVAVWDFVEEHLHHLPIHLTSGNSTTAIIERSPKILFDRLIAFYVQKGLPVPIDAGKFQQGLRERFIERDGMFFTNEQVQEYDKKKKENPEFIQLSILVSSEQDGVLWLKNVLAEKALTYQDIHPQWMQALAGVRKGDVIPELATILEENFLKDDKGKWYAPDPENEADLEKLRTKRLLKQFETYKEEALKPKTKKIKEVRVESLRAGFKQCYQDKDFKTIVAIGDKIPNNLLMEDEVLLQFYDIASSRV